MKACLPQVRVKAEQNSTGQESRLPLLGNVVVIDQKMGGFPKGCVLVPGVLFPGSAGVKGLSGHSRCHLLGGKLGEMCRCCLLL